MLRFNRKGVHEIALPILICEVEHLIFLNHVLVFGSDGVKRYDFIGPYLLF